MSQGKLPPPPVPERLREMFVDFPDLVDSIQKTLDCFVETSSPGVDPFDRIVWLLEDRLGGFIVQATAELEHAQASGDEERISAAKRKIILMSRAARKATWIGDDGLWNYVQKYGHDL